MSNNTHERLPLFTSLQYTVMAVATISGTALGAVLLGSNGALPGFFAGGLIGVRTAVSFFF